MTSHYDLAREFSKGAEKGTASRMFIEKDTIYSYGNHFPIAKRTKWGYLFNSKGYSSSTARHKRYVQNSLKGIIIHIKDCKFENSEKQITQNNEDIKDLTGKIIRARKEEIKEI